MGFRGEFSPHGNCDIILRYPVLFLKVSTATETSHGLGFASYIEAAHHFTLRTHGLDICCRNYPEIRAQPTYSRLL